MGKRLEDRSLEELWQLFPIFLVPYKKEWAGWYREEKSDSRLRCAYKAFA